MSTAAAPPDHETVDLWKTLQGQLAFSAYVPVRVPASQVEEAAFVRDSGETYHVLKQREHLTYLSLPPDAYELWTMMDGTTPVRTIAIEFALTHRRMVTGVLRGLVDELRDKGFLQDRPVGIFSGLDERRQRKTTTYWLMALLNSIVSRDLVKLRRGDATIGALYRTLGWIFFTPPFLVAMLVTIGGGFAAWVALLAFGEYSLVKTDGSYLLGFVSLLLLDTLATSLHELGHALGVKHAGRSVNHLGVLLYYGTPCAYVAPSTISACCSTTARPAPT
jgi:putative peptide zinc metalloprotease protein